MKKIFSKILSNDVELVLNYTLTPKYDEPHATIDGNEISMWWVTDLRNSLQTLGVQDAQIVINDIVWNLETIEEMHQFLMEGDSKIDSIYKDEEEKYNGPKES